MLTLQSALLFFATTDGIVLLTLLFWIMFLKLHIKIANNISFDSIPSWFISNRKLILFDAPKIVLILMSLSIDAEWLEWKCLKQWSHLTIYFGKQEQDNW